MLSERTNRALEGIRKCSLGGKAKVRDLFEIIAKHPDLWLQSYANIYANKGAQTKGIDEVTQDRFSYERVNNLIKLIKEKRYFPKPVRRVNIPKANGKTRPLGIPSGDDKLVQEVIRMILETIYEPAFSPHSHGFRPEHSCHTALTEIKHCWIGSVWFIEFDIKGCFDNIDHEILMKILEKRIDDQDFLQIIRRMLRAGVMEGWKYNKTYTGTPQGGIVSPILANIYLNELDEFIANINYNKGNKRATNKESRKLEGQVYKLRQQLKEMAINSRQATDEYKQILELFKELSKKKRAIPRQDLRDEQFRRLCYCRYADDFLIGIIGNKEEAISIKDQVEMFLCKELKLELSAKKTGIRHAKTEGTTFLGYNIAIESGEKVRKFEMNGSYCLERTHQVKPMLRVPEEKLKDFCEKRHYGQWDETKITHRSELIGQSDVEIISTYNAELRGIANYYALACDAKYKLNKLFYLAEGSLIKTLAAKHKTTSGAIRAKLRCDGNLVYQYEVQGKPKELKLIKLSDLQLQSQTSIIVDIKPNTMIYTSGTELLQRLNAQECEICSKSEGYFDVHHIRKMSDLKDGKERWQKLMIARSRKTLILCVECHDLLHIGKLPDWRFKDK